MIRSMTGFAGKRFTSATLSLEISAKSLNHRYFDWNFRGDQAREAESRLRAVCQKKIFRGRVEVFIGLKFLDSRRWEVDIDEGLLSKLLSALNRVSSGKLKSASFSIENLLGIPHLVEIKARRLTREEVSFLERSFEKTLDELIREKTREGTALKEELRDRVERLRKIASRLEKLALRQPALMQEKFLERIKELAPGISFPEEKLLEEAALLAQRYDLSEEISRLKSHLAQVLELLSPQSLEPSGKALDFLAQELYREANTINAKAQDVEIIREGLAVKAEVESIRQQVQNLE